MNETLARLGWGADHVRRVGLEAGWGGWRTRPQPRRIGRSGWRGVNALGAERVVGPAEAAEEYEQPEHCACADCELTPGEAARRREGDDWGMGQGRCVGGGGGA